MLQLTVIGNLGSDARIEESNGKKFVSFSVGHNDRWTDDAGVNHESTNWVSCALNGDGGNLLPHLKKGKQVYVSGRCRVRVYSSPTEKRMVAGLNISVERVELLGGTTDEVPRRLYDNNGQEHQVNKAYYIAAGEVAALIPIKEKSTILLSRSGQQFNLDKSGWLIPIVQQPEQQPQQEQVFKEPSYGNH